MPSLKRERQNRSESSEGSSFVSARVRGTPKSFAVLSMDLQPELVRVRVFDRFQSS